MGQTWWLLLLPALTWRHMTAVQLHVRSRKDSQGALAGVISMQVTIMSACKVTNHTVCQGTVNRYLLD